MRRILSRSLLQRAVLTVVVILLAFGPITAALAVESETEAPTEAPTQSQAEATETTADQAAEDDAAVEEGAQEEVVPTEEASGEVTATAEDDAAEDEATAAQAGDNGPYTPDPDATPSPSGNGNGDGGGGRPCGGCVGGADGKNPPGQLPGGEDDSNNGYECDGNSGGGKTNPAHSGCRPGVAITKSPDPQTVVSGGTATWTIKVTNTGQIPLTGVTVSDPLAPACDRVIGDLAVGASREYTCTLANVTAAFTNKATVTTTQGVTDDDTADVLVNPAPSPALAIEKSPDTQTVVSGGTATWTINVTNTGNVALTGVVVTDPRAPDCDATIGNLAVGASNTYTCTLANVTASFTNVATADSNQTGPVSDDADVVVTPAPAPALTIEKGPDTQTVVSGGTATWTIKVTNTGNVPLTNVVVTDPLAPDCDEPIGNLAVGASDTYTCTLANVTASFTNVATADSTETGPVSDDADVVVTTAPNAAVDIQKSPDEQTVVAGESVTWTITVRNTGNVTLTGVEVSDPLAPDCSADIGNLAVGGVETYECTRADVQSSFTNVATVSTNETPDDDDDANVSVIPEADGPSILLHKTASVEEGAVAGDLVTYTFEIINNGDVTLTNVRLDDPRVGGNVPILDTTLTPGEVTRHSGTVTYTLTQADIDAGQVPNTAEATGTPPVGPDVSSESSALVLLEADPGIRLDKSGPEDARAGDVITYTFTVTNTGTVRLTNVSVTDPLLGLSNLPVSPSTLAPGASGTARATYTVTEDDATAGSVFNTAVARGRTPDGETPEDPDDHTVIVPPTPTPQDPPRIRLVKSGPATAEVGDTVTYTFRVTNTGGVRLTNVRVSDPMLGGRLTVTPSTLAAGESGTATATYVITPADGEAGEVLNTAVATGTPPQGPPVRDGDEHEITVPDDPGPGPDPDPDPDPDLPATGAGSTGYALTALFSLLLGAMFLRLAGSPAVSGSSQLAALLRGPDANALHMMLRRMHLVPKPGGRQPR